MDFLGENNQKRKKIPYEAYVNTVYTECMRHFEEAGSSKPSLNIKKTAKINIFRHKKLRQIAPVKNQLQQPVLPFYRAHLGPMQNFR